MWSSLLDNRLAVLFLLQTCKGFSFNLCAYFIRGGTCNTSCQLEALHVWGLPLCMHTSASGSKCCIPSDHPLVQLRRTTTTTTTVPTNIVVPSFSCGRSRGLLRRRRMVGGNEAPPGTWPWQVAIRLYTGQYLCGGLIISDKWILTAAHCLHTPYDDVNLLRIFAGDQTLSYSNHGRGNYKTIRRIIQHEHFRHNVAVNVTDSETGLTYLIKGHFHDIALVELTESLTFSDTVQAICLPDDESYDPYDCLVAGWGENNDQSNDASANLMEVYGEAVDYSQCGERWGTQFSSDVVCFASSGTGPCKGDSGGGMTCRNPNGGFSLIGIISWGRDDCVHDEHPSVLTKVLPYREWIDSYIQSSND